ncbi:MAG: hypothetical protein EA376_05620 [Phycisphaeraceae bacterium]|nr:MAG: hypothetical protein EA376_05620 [Phycisphaeraceae bacterium]
MTLSLTNKTTRRSLTLIFTMAMAGAFSTGCSFFGGSDGKSAARSQPPVAQLDETRKTETRRADRNGESFFDPFSNEADSATDGERPRTIAATNRSRTWANPSSISVYGDLGGSSESDSVRYDGAENLMQITFSNEGADFDPDITKDGRFLVFSSTQHRPTSDIYIKRVGSRALTQLTSSPGNDVMPTFSPDGARVAFTSDRTGAWNIYVMNSNGGQAVQLTDDIAAEMHPSWSPDGSRLVYCRLGTTSNRWEVWVLDVANPAVKRFLGYGLFPKWSPTGDRILFQRSRERGERLFSVWMMDYVNGEGINPTEIISSSVAAVVNPTWSPDGRRIAFATIPNPQHELGERPYSADLWIVNLDGSGRANLTGGRFVNLMPVWGADNRILFVSDRSGRDSVWSLAPEKAILAATGPRTGGSEQNLANVPLGGRDDDN